MKHLLSLADDEMVLEVSIVSEGQREIRGLMKLFSSSCLWMGCRSLVTLSVGQRILINVRMPFGPDASPRMQLSE